MKPNIPLMFGIGLLTLLSACQVDKDPMPIVSTPAATAATFNDLSNQALKNLVQTKNFDAGAALNWTSVGNVNITIPANCIKSPDGTTTTTGMVDLEFVEVFGREHMLTTAMPTTGIDPSDNTQKIMQSGGEFKIEVKKAGITQKCNCATLKVPFDTAKLSFAEAQLMKIFKLDTNLKDPNKKVWKIDDRANIKVQDGQNTGFSISLPEFGWTNVDKFYSFTGPKIKIMATAPAGYDNTNSSIYLMYKNMPNALARFDTYDAASKVFSEHYGQIPVGQVCHVIFVTEDSGYWKYAIKQNVVIPASETTYNFSLTETVTADRASFINTLKTLP